MRIAVFASYLPPHVGGIEAVVDGQVKALDQVGEEVTVITSACGSAPGLTAEGGCAIRRIRALNYFEKKLGAVFPIYSPSLLWHSYRAVKSADIVHAHDAFYLTSLAAAFWARLLRKPMVLTQHVDMVPHPMKLVGLVQRIVYATTGRFVLRTSSSVIVLNSRVRSFLVQRGIPSERIVFLPNAVDTDTFAPVEPQAKRQLRRDLSLPENSVLALFVGRFVPKKGFSTLLKVADDGLGVVFAGGNAPAGHRQSTHHFLGEISRSRMPDVFNACDLFVLPSCGEGFPVTVQEAMASGLPIVTTNDPAYDLYDLDASLVRLIDNDLDCVKKALLDVAGDPELRARMGGYSRAYALRHFATATHITRLREIYKDQIV